MSRRPLRIALATYSTRARGGVVHTLALAEALAERGHDVTVWTLARGGDTGCFRPVDPRVLVRAVPFPDRPDESVGARVLRSIDVLGAAMAAAADRPDVVHAQDCISANAAGPCVRTVHHLDAFTTPELAACHDRAVRAPHTLVCVSAAVATEVAAAYGRSPEVIPNGVDAARFAAAAADHEGRAAWRARLGPRPIVLAVGGIEPRKGSLELLEAMALRPDLRLVVAGGETLFDYRDYRARFDARRAELGLDAEVLGPVAHDVLPALVAEADALAFPSTKEGFGLAAMEALAAGVPVVARDLPVLREVFGDAVTYAHDAPSLAAALAEAALAPADRPAARARAARGRALAERHTWAAAAGAHEALYRRVLSPSG